MGDESSQHADPLELLEVALAAARGAGEILLRHRREGGALVGTKSSDTDPVTEADLAAEQSIRNLLAERRPDDGILGEEGGGHDGTSGLRWVVDPLDGTVNFSFDLPQWCVSVACEDEQGVLCGVVLDPVAAEEFSAARGHGATLNGQPITGSERTDLATALVATGFGYDADQRRRQAELVAGLIGEVRDIRRLGAAALDLAFAACGRCDIYFEHGTQPWDVAAGSLICEEAGLVVRPLHTEGLPAGVLAAPAGLVDALQERLAG